MPITAEFERAAAIERRIEALVATMVDAQLKGSDISTLQTELDSLSKELAHLRTPRFAVAA